MIDKRLDKVLRTTKGHLNKLNHLGVETVRDFLHYFPRDYNDHSQYTKVVEVRTDQVNNLKGKLSNIVNLRSKRNRKITKAIFTDDSGSIEVVWFNQPHLIKLLPRNKEIVLSGKAKFAFGKISLVSPNFEVLQSKTEQIHTGRIVPVYHETEGIHSKWIRAKIKPLIDDWINQLEEYMPPEILERQSLCAYRQAIRNIHFPQSEKKLLSARERLAFDELFILQLKVLQKKWYWQNIKRSEIKKISLAQEAVDQCINELHFDLTNAQKRALSEINQDLEKDYPMSRLVQGDVGSGKTIVSALASLNVIQNGYQVAIMAPTEILAKQHYETFIKTLKKFGLNIQFIAGSTSNKQKEEIVRQMKTGTADIVIGTHALIQEGISFRKLGLAIIDEQHRFGVKQREILKAQGSPHLLCMTATPIPRTLAITVYGDQDLSLIDEMPQGRKAIITRCVPEKKRIDAYRWIEDQVKKGRQAFVICPLIDESDTLEVKSVLQEYAYLKEHIFPGLNIGLLHGKMKQEEKETVMKGFQNNEINILVSTSVIEVGIDVPNASIMLIEGAERFGLAQLHQFRGRVGRGQHQSYCFLFTGKLSEVGKKRMKAMEQHNSGFKLSEIDLEIRGPGEIYGLKQSGIPDLKLASLTDSKTIEKARKEAQALINSDPTLQKNPQLAEKIAEISEVYVED